MTDIGAMTVSEAGWTSIDGHTMRWVGEVDEHALHRDILQIKGTPSGVAFTVGYLNWQADPADDPRTVEDEALNDGCEAILPLPALIVLRSMLESAISAMEETAS